MKQEAIVSVDDPLWTPLQTAEYLGVAEDTLRDWRTDRLGPVYIRMGRNVRYRKSAVDRWLAEHQVDPAAESKRRR